VVPAFASSWFNRDFVVTDSCPIKLDHGVIGNGRVLALVAPKHAHRLAVTTCAFSICSFWWAEALAMVGRLEDACMLFERLSKHANCVGLFSEDIEPRTGMLLGNFPQAYTHVGLINTAVTISELIEAREMRFRAWS
jgi:hypothetical protein